MSKQPSSDLLTGRNKASRFPSCLRSPTLSKKAAPPSSKVLVFYRQLKLIPFIMSFSLSRLPGKHISLSHPAPLIFNPLHTDSIPQQCYEQARAPNSLWAVFTEDSGGYSQHRAEAWTTGNAFLITYEAVLYKNSCFHVPSEYFSRSACVKESAGVSVTAGGGRGGSTYRAPIGRTAQTRVCSTALSIMRFILSFAPSH